MKTGLTKKQKRTSIYFTEADEFVEICTYNTDFKKRRFGIRLTAPYSEKRREAASNLAKKNTQNLRRTTK